jgi:ADP-heptose:LPS heptosyltransferase
VTVDTSALHLAGAMGVPTLALMPAYGDNRWGLFGERTPYYDSVTLLRQDRLGEWEPVIASAAELVRAAWPDRAS